MNSNSSFLILLIVGAIAGAFLLLSSPFPTSETAAVGMAEGSLATSPRAATSSGSVWVDAGEDQTVGERETIQLKGTGGDSGGGSVSYRWTADSSFGFFSDPTQVNAKYTAPSACDCCTTVTLTLTVTGRSGTSASDSLVVRVRDVFGCREHVCGEPCVAVAPPCPAAAVESRCPEPDTPCAGPCVSEAPTAPVCAQIPVPCRCAEGCGEVWDSAWPQIAPALEAADRPTPRIVRQFPSHVAEGSTAAFSAVVTNPSCSSVCFAWSVSQGWLENADTLEPIYHAPLTDLPQGERVVITFTIHDASGRPSYDQIRIQVDNVPSS